MAAFALPVGNPAAGDLFPGSLGWSLVGAVWAWTLAVLLGASLLRGSRLLAWAVFGIAVESALWLLLSALGSLTPGPVLLVAAIATVAGALLGGKRVIAELRSARWSPDAAPRWLGWVALASLVLVVLLALRLATLPSAYYDDLVYHLGLPRQALLLGSWPTLPQFHPALMPAAWETAYVLPLSLGGGSGPQLMNAIGLALLAGAAYRLGRLGGGRSAALAAVALLVCSPLFLGVGSLAGNDLFAGLALAVALERLCVTSGQRPAEVGLLAGAAWAAKFTALPGVVALGLGAALLSPGPGGKRAVRGAIVVLAALLVGMGWTARAFVHTGNPLYPSFFGALGGRGWSAQAAAILSRDSSLGAFPDRGLTAFLAAPLDVVRTGGNLGTPGGIGLAFLAIAALGLLLSRRVGKARALLVFLAVGYVGWAATSLMLRFAIALLLALVPFAAALLQRAWDLAAPRFGATDAVASLLLACALVLPTVHGVERELVRLGEDASFWRTPPRVEILPARISLAAAGRAMASRLPPGARVLLIGDGRLALMPRPTVLSTGIDEPAVGRYLEGVRSAAELETRLAREFTHVVVNYRELRRFADQYGFVDRLPPNGRALLAECFGPSRPPTGQWGEVAVFELRRP